MRLTYWAAWIAGAAAIAHSAQVPDASGHVAVISIDGLGARELFHVPSCISPRSTIRALAKRGAYSQGVTGILPTITYPSHATLATGTTPERHGVIDNGMGGVWFKNRSDIKVSTIWDAAHAAGRTVAIVTWPSTYGATADWLVPEDLTNFAVATEQIRNGSTQGLFDSLVAATGRPVLRPFFDPEAGTPLDEMTGRFAAEVVRRHKPQLLLTHFLDYDHRMHASPYSAAACQALGRIDGWIGKIVDAYRDAGILDRTTFFVISDHGFIAVKKMVSVFALLKQAGWDELFPGQDVATAFEIKNAGGAAAFYPRSAKPGAGAQTAFSRLHARIESKFGRLVRWISPRDAHRWGGFPGAAFTLCANPGYAFTTPPPANRELLVDPGSIGAMHGYCPDRREMDALFIASGDGVRPAGVLPKMSMVDVAPTIGAYLSLTLPEASGRDRSATFRSASRRPAGR